jgi:cyanate lyase
MMPAENKENNVDLAERVKNGSESAGLKLNIKKNREMKTGDRVKITVNGE